MVGLQRPIRKESTRFSLTRILCGLTAPSGEWYRVNHDEGNTVRVDILVFGSLSDPYQGREFPKGRPLYDHPRPEAVLGHVLGTPVPVPEVRVDSSYD